MAKMKERCSTPRKKKKLICRPNEDEESVNQRENIKKRMKTTEYVKGVLMMKRPVTIQPKDVVGMRVESQPWR